MRAIVSCAACLLVFTVAGCIRPPAVRVDRLVPTASPPAASASEATLKLAAVTGGQAPIASLMSLPENVRIPNQALYQGLYETLVKAKLFKAVVAAGDCDYELVAEIGPQEIHQLGIMTFSFSLLVNYSLVDKREQKNVLTEHIFSHGMGKGRLPNAARRAAESAVRENIASFMTKLASFLNSLPKSRPVGLGENGIFSPPT